MNHAFSPSAYYRPGSLGEAVALLSRFGARARLIAGGTDLLAKKSFSVIGKHAPRTDAIGARMKELCITPEKILEALDRIGLAENARA